MAGFWVALGIVVLGAGLADIFLTSLNYDESGFLATPLCAVQWQTLRQLTRRLPRRWRPVALRQATGLQIGLSLLTWLVFVVVGYGLIYYGSMSGRAFQFDGRGLGAGVFGALYLSAAQLATVGTSQVTPETDTLRALTIVETFTGVVLVTLALTFLLGVYQVVRDLSALCARLVDVGRAEGNTVASDPVASLAPYFPGGQVTGVDAHLQGLHDTFSSYMDGLRLHHVAYWFQSGRDEFSLPFALDMLGGVVAALRWGLPGDHPAAQQPALTILTVRFAQFADYLHEQLRWLSSEAPEVVDVEAFAAAHGGGRPGDLWVARFLILDREMARLARTEVGQEPAEAYQRYAHWLPFAFRVQQLVAAVSRDLDYQPVLRPASQAPGPTPGTRDKPVAAPGAGGHRVWAGLRLLLYRWVAVPDPGLTRFAGGARAVLSAVAGVGIVYLILTAAGVGEALPAAMFGGMVGMQASVMASDPSLAGRKLTTLLLFIPALVGVSVGAAADPSPAAAIGTLVGVVLVGVWVRRFGPRFFALGQLLFMSCYFALLLHLPLQLVPWVAVAAAVGLAWAYLARFVLIPERPARVLRNGLRAFDARLTLLLGPLIDAVAAGRWDPDVRHQARADLRQLHRCARFLEGRLRMEDTAGTGDSSRSEGLRLRLFDVELAASNLVRASRDVAGAGTAVRRVLRAELAGMLETTQTRLREQRSAGGSGMATPLAVEGSPGQADADRWRWPAPAYRLRAALAELLDAADAVRVAAAGAEVDPATVISQLTAEGDAAAGRRPDEKGLSATSRQAIQAGVATGVALLVGAAISPERQYWAAIAAFVVFGGTETVGQTMLKGAQRVAGTLAGAIVGFGVATLTGAAPAVVLPLVVVCVFAAMYVLSVSYTQMCFWITMMIALLYEYLGKLSAEALGLRVLETLVGAVIALAAAALLLPTRTRDRVTTDLLGILAAVGGITETCLTPADRPPQAGGGAPSAAMAAAVPDTAGLAERTLALNGRLQQLYDDVAPARRVAGALRRDGVERLLTALQAIAYFARHLSRAANRSTGAGTAGVPAPVLDRLRTMTGDNLHALAQVIDGHPAGQVHDLDEALFSASGPEQGRGRDPVVSNVMRINQAVVTLIDDLGPGEQESATDD